MTSDLARNRHSHGRCAEGPATGRPVEPGTQVGYHAYTFGYLFGEIVRCLTSRELGDVLDDPTAAIECPGEIRYRMRETGGLAVLEDAPPDVDWSQMADDLPMFRRVPVGPPDGRAGRRPGVDRRMLAADIPARAKVTARAARLYAGRQLGRADPERGVAVAVAVTKNVLSIGLHHGAAHRQRGAVGRLGGCRSGGGLRRGCRCGSIHVGG